MGFVQRLTASLFNQTNNPRDHGRGGFSFVQDAPFDIGNKTTSPSSIRLLNWAIVIVQVQLRPVASISRR